jgi:hypothetical protein
MRVQDAFAEFGDERTGSNAGRTSSQISRSDLLRYVGDMVEELQVMADRTGCQTLTGLLALARAEAALQQSALGLRR